MLLNNNMRHKLEYPFNVILYTNGIPAQKDHTHIFQGKAIYGLSHLKLKFI
jgi:hypothetical protein